MFSICSMNTEYVVAANVLSKNQKQSFNKAIEKFIKDEMIPDEEVKNVYFSLYDLDRDGRLEVWVIVDKKRLNEFRELLKNIPDFKVTWRDPESGIDMLK